MKACVINNETNVVENVVMLGGLWRAPEGSYLVVVPEDNLCSIGDIYDEATGEFITPEPSPESV